MRLLTPAGTARLAAVAALALLAVAGPARADTIAVSSSEDEFGAGLACTLREAIEATNLNLSFGGCQNTGTQPDVIKVPSSQRTLDGPGEDLNATGDFDITGDVTIEVAEKAFEHSRALIQDIQNRGHDRMFDVHAGATLTLRDVSIQYSTLAPSSGESGSQIRVATGAGLRVSDSDLGFSGSTHLIANAGVAVLSRVDLGGVDGAIRNTGWLRADRLVINNSHGVYGGIDNSGIASIENATVINGATIPIPTPAGSYSGGVVNRPGGTLYLENSILSDNSRGELSVPEPIFRNVPDDCDGDITSLGYNIVKAPGCSIAPGPGDQLGVDPKLDPKGHTTVQPFLLPGSPAIDAGSPASPADAPGPCSEYDFQNVLLNGRCDIGASEIPAYVDVQIPTCQGDDVTLPPIPGGGTVRLPLTRAIVMLLRDGDDKLIGTPFGDTICAAGGDDRVSGAGGTDDLAGEKGNDVLSGDRGADRLTGGPGRDILRGGPGRDILVGGAGRDKLIGGAGVDRCRQGSGRFVRC